MSGENNELTEQIESLLSSEDPEDLGLGLEMLDKHYRRPVGGMLRTWSDDNQYGLRDDDLPLVWQDTLISLVTMIEDDDFEPRGHLVGLLLTIGRWRAIDCLRKRDERTINGVDLSARSYRAEDPQDLDGIVTSILHGMSKLSPFERLVLEVFALLWDINDGTPSLSDLTAAVNQKTNEEKTKYAVKSALQRARKKVREHLEKKGYWHG